MAQLDGLKFSKTHEWVRAEGEIATVGVSQHAVDELGDVLSAAPHCRAYLQDG
jgi:glycine cleavage system H lipoate-binding protein